MSSLRNKQKTEHKYNKAEADFQEQFIHNQMKDPYVTQTNSEEEYPKNYAGEPPLKTTLTAIAKHKVIDTAHNIQETISETMHSTAEYVKEAFVKNFAEPLSELKRHGKDEKQKGEIVSVSEEILERAWNLQSNDKEKDERQ